MGRRRRPGLGGGGRRLRAFHGRPGGLGGAQYRHEILARLAGIADALGDAQRVERFQDLDRETTADARRIAELRGREGGGARERVRRGREDGERRARVEAVRRHPQDLAGAALAVQEVLEGGLLELERRRELGHRGRGEARRLQRGKDELPHPLVLGIRGCIVTRNAQAAARYFELALVGELARERLECLDRQLRRKPLLQRRGFHADRLRVSAVEFAHRGERLLAQAVASGARDPGAALLAEDHDARGVVQRRGALGLEREYPLEARDVHSAGRILERRQRRLGRALLQRG